MERVFAFEKAEVSVRVSRRRGMGKVALHVSMCLSTDSYSKVNGKRPILCSHLSLLQGEAVDRNRGKSRPPCISKTSHIFCLFQDSDLEEMNTHVEGPLTFPLVP